MYYERFLCRLFQIPFLTKRLIVLFLICLFSHFSAQAFPAAADNDNNSAEQSSSASDDARQLGKQAKKLTEKGDFPEAETVLRHLIEISPKESKARLNLAYVLVKQRRFLEAYDLSFDVAKAEPKNSYAFAVLGTVLLTSGNFHDAKISFLNALNLNRKESLAWAGLGTLNFYENRMFDGLANLRTAVYFEPDEPDYLFTLAQVASRAEQFKEAAAAYEKFLQISPRTDTDRRDRIKGLIKFLQFLGNRQSLYNVGDVAQSVVPLRLINDRPFLKIKVNKNQEPLNFILDTGSGISVISQETAQKLHIKAVSRGGTAKAVGGDGKFEIVYGFLQSVDIGDIKIKNVPVYIRKFHSNDEHIDGYIGLSLISKFLTTLDYSNLTFTLKRKDLAGNKAAEENADLSLPLRLTSSGFLSGEVQLEGIETPLNFVVDTGASVSVISAVLARTKEISRYIRNEKLRVIGAAGITDNVSSFLLPRVTFGTNSRESLMAVSLDLDLINEASGFEQAGILGGNFLKNYCLTFDFSKSKVIFVPTK